MNNTTINSISTIIFFENEEGYGISIEDFDEGFATVQIPISLVPYDNKLILCIVNGDAFVNFISGCFSKESNFKEMLFKAFDCDSDAEFIGFKLMQGEFIGTVTEENSSPYKIDEVLKSLLNSFTTAAENQLKEATDQYNQKVNSLFDFIDGLEIDFNSFRAEEEYEELAEGRDEESLGYGENFIAYAQYLIRDKHYNVPEAVSETYEQLELIGNRDWDGVDSIRFICKFCKYGDEILASYIVLMMGKVNDELDKL